jgi:hypothetical protein
MNNTQTKAPGEQLTCKQAAELFECTPETVKRWCKDGTVQSLKNPRGAFTLMASDLEPLLRERPKVKSKFHPANNTNQTTVQKPTEESTENTVTTIQDTPQPVDTEKSSVDKPKITKDTKGSRVHRETPPAKSISKTELRKSKSKSRKPPTPGLVSSLFRQLTPADQYAALESMKNEFTKNLSQKPVT